MLPEAIWHDELDISVTHCNRIVLLSGPGSHSATHGNGREGPHSDWCKICIRCTWEVRTCFNLVWVWCLQRSLNKHICQFATSRLLRCSPTHATIVFRQSSQCLKLCFHCFSVLCPLHSEGKESACYLLTCEFFQAVFVYALPSFPRLYIPLKYIVGSQNSLCVIHWLISVYICASSHEPEVPPNAKLSIEVKLLEATDAPDLELLPPVERIALASLKREIGNVHYQRGDYAFAVNSYSIALQITESNSKGKMQARDSEWREVFVLPLKLKKTLEHVACPRKKRDKMFIHLIGALLNIVIFFLFLKIRFYPCVFSQPFVVCLLLQLTLVLKRRMSSWMWRWNV